MRAQGVENAIWSASGRACARGGERVRHAAGASAGGLGMGEGRLHLKIELVVDAPALPKSDLEAGLEEADEDQDHLRTEGGGGGEGM